MPEEFSDPELLAIHTIVEALQPLDQSQRKRALEYVMGREVNAEVRRQIEDRYQRARRLSREEHHGQS